MLGGDGDGDGDCDDSNKNEDHGVCVSGCVRSRVFMFIHFYVLCLCMWVRFLSGRLKFVTFLFLPG